MPGTQCKKVSNFLVAHILREINFDFTKTLKRIGLKLTLEIVQTRAFGELKILQHADFTKNS